MTYVSNLCKDAVVFYHRCKLCHTFFCILSILLWSCSFSSSIFTISCAKFKKSHKLILKFEVWQNKSVMISRGVETYRCIIRSELKPDVFGLNSGTRAISSTNLLQYAQNENNKCWNDLLTFFISPVDNPDVLSCSTVLCNSLNCSIISKY